MRLTNTPIKELNNNVFKLLDDDWMLLTAGNDKNFNTMTASWGAFGILWNKPIAICFIRPQRHTYIYANNFDFFTCTFFDESYRKILNYCGAHSGSKVDKIKETGLTPLILENGGVAFEEGKIVLECKKIYSDDLKADNFHLVEYAIKNYPKNDFHRFYIAEITNYLIKK